MFQNTGLLEVVSGPLSTWTGHGDIYHKRLTEPFPYDILRRHDRKGDVPGVSGRFLAGCRSLHPSCRSSQ
ncbi:hypothetical protein ACFL2Q_02720 [Thermodesulfobacteriota bacterium]